MTGKPTCDAPCHYGGQSAARKFSHAELGHMGHCNRTVTVTGERCWQHPHTARTWRLDLPGYKRPPLSENQRLHWAKKHRIGQQLRNDVLTLARAANLPRGLARVDVRLHWQAKVRRERDSDNPTPTLKVAIDALAAYGLVENDSSEHVTSGCVIEPTGPDAVWVTIEEVP